MKKGRKYKMAMDDERFREWFQPQHNPGVDPYTLKRSDRKPSLVHVYEDGIIQRLSPYSFFYVKWKKPSKPQGGEMAWDDERFREWFRPEQNPGVDPWKLRKDDETPLVRYHESGIVQRTTCKNLFRCNCWNPCRSRNALAMDYKAFQDWFQPEYNPGVDPWKLKKHDKTTPLVHYYDNGIVKRTMCSSLFVSKTWNVVKSRNSFAMEYREFREWYQPHHNVGVDPWSLRKSDEETPLKHVYEDGRIQNYTVRQVFAQKAWLPRKFRHQLAIDNDTFKDWFQPEHNLNVNLKKLYRTDNKTKLIHVFEDGTVQKITANNLITFNRWDWIQPEHKLAMEYPEFAAWFQPQYNVGIDPWSITRSDERHLIHVDKDGNERRVTPKTLFATNRWELIGKRGLLTNAIKEDEEIALFIPDEEMQEKAKRCKLAHEYTFKCPFCGEEFDKTIGYMIGRSPKCPSCRDLGFHKEPVDDKQSNGYFLTIAKEKKPA